MIFVKLNMPEAILHKGEAVGYRCDCPIVDREIKRNKGRHWANPAGNQMVIECLDDAILDSPHVQLIKLADAKALMDGWEAAREKHNSDYLLAQEELKKAEEDGVIEESEKVGLLASMWKWLTGK